LEKKLIFRKIEEKAKKNQQRGEKVKVLTNKDLLYLAIGVTLSVKKSRVEKLVCWFENQENESKSSKLDWLVMETGSGERETV